MTKKIFRSIFIVATAVLIACLVIIMGILSDYFAAVQKQQLTTQLDLAAQGASVNGIDYFKGLNADNCRITWVDADGKVLYDTKADAKTMENHAHREEIKEAFENGNGDSERYSDTVFEKTIYKAKKLTDGTVLRVSITQNSVWSIILGMLQPICVIIVIALILSFILALRLSKRIVQPLNSLNLDHPLENDTYDELSPLLTRIEKQHLRIKEQTDELKRRQDEFYAITSGMNEGLILLGKNDSVISINKAAKKLFGVDGRCIEENIVTVCKDTKLQKVINSAHYGNHKTINSEIAGREYEFTVSPVYDGKAVGGICILTVDVTEKAQAERIRREFTANVSHELKTPLHSIMGSAELMENGLVKSEDISRFTGRIRSEASRLVALIDDIIRLSQLDEGGGNLKCEKIDLRKIADEVKINLENEAKKKTVSINVSGENVEVNGIRRLLFEIVYNLCDNAIKYNTEGGSVDISVLHDNDKKIAVLTVKDTGIGIPSEHKERIFERFYRVDKSHSRETGGTGLGLSIVKHAAEYHNAEITVDSEPGHGTKICVTIPD